MKPKKEIVIAIFSFEGQGYKLMSSINIQITAMDEFLLYLYAVLITDHLCTHPPPPKKKEEEGFTCVRKNSISLNLIRWRKM